MAITLENKLHNTLIGEILYPNGAGNVSDVRSPRQKFKFHARFSSSSGMQTLADIPIKNITLPEITVESKVVQQYNAKRVVQQKINYGTCTMEIVDTHDNFFTDKIYLPYFSNCYNGGVGLSNNPTSLGYTPTDTETQKRTDLYSISIIVDGGPDELEKVYNLQNCFITIMSNNNLDYSDSEVVTYTMTVQPELITITTGNSAGNSNTTPDSNTSPVGVEGANLNDVSESFNNLSQIRSDITNTLNEAEDVAAQAQETLDQIAANSPSIEDLETEISPEPSSNLPLGVVEQAEIITNIAEETGFVELGSDLGELQDIFTDLINSQT